MWDEAILTFFAGLRVLAPKKQRQFSGMSEALGCLLDQTHVKSAFYVRDLLSGPALVTRRDYGKPRKVEYLDTFYLNMLA